LGQSIEPAERDHLPEIVEAPGAGSIPEIYGRLLVPLIFKTYPGICHDRYSLTE
jgi:hypothetical protein